MIDLMLEKAKILIVDDQQANLDVLTGLLDVKGFTNYLITQDSRQVFKLFDEFKPDLLLLDLKMPNLTGFEVMAQLKSLIPANTYFPILVLTADITTETKQKALAGGASDFISKPFDLIEVELRIKNLLQARYLHQQIKDKNQILEENEKERKKILANRDVELKAAKEKAHQSNIIKTTLIDQLSKTKNEATNKLSKAGIEKAESCRTILYVKDNLSNYQIIEQILITQRPHFRLITNTFGKNTVQFAIDYTTDLILLDLHLPDIHGSEVIKLLKSEPSTDHIPIIILSADAITNQIEKLMYTGNIDFLMVPFDETKFLNIVDYRISKRNN